MNENLAAFFRPKIFSFALKIEMKKNKLSAEA